MLIAEKLMQTVAPGELHLVVAERLDQVVGVMWTLKPKQVLSNLSSTTHLGRAEIEPAKGAKRVVTQLAARFEASITASTAEAFWTTADFEEIKSAIAEYDLATGMRIENAGVKVGSEVQINNLGRGTVTGFDKSGRLMVTLERPRFSKGMIAIAPRSEVKPVIRAAS